MINNYKDVGVGVRVGTFLSLFFGDHRSTVASSVPFLSFSSAKLCRLNR